MVDLSSNYLGRRLRSPIIASASPITRNVATVRQLVAAGAAAIVLPSLLEDEIVQEEIQLDRALEAGSHTTSLKRWPISSGRRLL